MADLDDQPVLSDLRGVQQEELRPLLDGVRSLAVVAVATDKRKMSRRFDEMAADKVKT